MLALLFPEADHHVVPFIYIHTTSGKRTKLQQEIKVQQNGTNGKIHFVTMLRKEKIIINATV